MFQKYNCRNQQKQPKLFDQNVDMIFLKKKKINNKKISFGRRNFNSID